VSLSDVLSNFSPCKLPAGWEPVAARHFQFPKEFRTAVFTILLANNRVFRSYSCHGKCSGGSWNLPHQLWLQVFTFAARYSQFFNLFSPLTKNLTRRNECDCTYNSEIGSRRRSHWWSKWPPSLQSSGVCACSRRRGLGVRRKGAAWQSAKETSSGYDDKTNSTLVQF
jgi:hypothetical protein